MYTCLWVFISKAIIQSFTKVILIVHDTLGTRFTTFVAPHHHSTYIVGKHESFFTAVAPTWSWFFFMLHRDITTFAFYRVKNYFTVVLNYVLVGISQLCKFVNDLRNAITTWLLHSARMWIPVTEWLANDVSRQHFGVNINSVRPLCTRQTYRNVEPVTQCYTAQGGWSQMRRFGSNKTCTTFLLLMILKLFLLLNLLWIATKFIKLKLLKPVVIMSSKTSILSIILK